MLRWYETVESSESGWKSSRGFLHLKVSDLFPMKHLRCQWQEVQQVLIDDTATDKFRFDVQTASREFHLEADTPESRETWVYQSETSVCSHPYIILLGATVDSECQSLCMTWAMLHV